MSEKIIVSPIAILADSRLTLRQHRVLLALYSFRDNNTGLCWPSRAKLSELTGYSEDRISAVTTELVALGWVTKDGDGGRNRTAQYAVYVPKEVEEKLPKSGSQETLPKSETLPKMGSQETLPKSGSKTLPKSGSKTLPKSGRGIRTNHIELTNELTSIAGHLPEAMPAPKKSAAPNPKNQQAWAAYEQAYFARYKVHPVRNAKVNSQIAQLVQRIGEDAHHVAAWYVGHRGQWYTQKAHSVDALLKDCEALRTQWATGQQITTRRAQDMDRSVIGSVSHLLDDEPF